MGIRRNGLLRNLLAAAFLHDQDPKRKPRLVADEELPIRYVEGLSDQRRGLLSAKHDFYAANLINYIRGNLGSWICSENPACALALPGRIARSL
jgi:hypothetical protein